MESFGDDENQLKFFLMDADLLPYLRIFKDVMKITKVSQLKNINSCQLSSIGFTRAERKRFQKTYDKHFSIPCFDKFKGFIGINKRNLLKQSDHLLVEMQQFMDTSISVPTKHIIAVEDISINKELGMGQFGIVQQGTWNTGNQRVQVAIKCLGQERMTSNSTEFLKEAAVMHSIEHPNIVKLYGVVLHLDNLMLVTELAPLRSLLECLRETSLRANFPVLSLCDFAEQICEGMTYLEKKRLIHRDLAARNILVFNKNKVKISDFGLSRALGAGKDYYQTNYNVNLKLPVAWCAPECILYLRFTSASDVWAFGVCLWEMFSYGFQPWAACSGQQILEAIDSPKFQRLERPDCCPNSYYSVMCACWSHDPNKRPKFSDLRVNLRDARPDKNQAPTPFRQTAGIRRGCVLDNNVAQVSIVPEKENLTLQGFINDGSCNLLHHANTKSHESPRPPSQVLYKPTNDLEQVPLIVPNSPSHPKPNNKRMPYPLECDGDDYDKIDSVGDSQTTPRNVKKNPHRSVSEPNRSRNLLNMVKSATLGRSYKVENKVTTKTIEVHEYHEITYPDSEGDASSNIKTETATSPESPKDTSDFGEILLDEMEFIFKNIGQKRKNEHVQDSDGSNRNNGSKKKSSLGTMRQMSAQEEKTLNTAVALANEITSKSMNDLDGPSKPSPSPSDKHKLSFKFGQLSINNNTVQDNNKDTTGKQERRNFSDEMKANTKDIQSSITKESKAAYACLIEEPTPTTSRIRQVVRDAKRLYKTATMPKLVLASNVKNTSKPATMPRPPVTFKVSPNWPKPDKKYNANLKTGARPKEVLFQQIPSTSRSHVDEKIVTDQTKPVQNVLPLPPRSTKLLLVDMPRHIRKYPLVMPKHCEPQQIHGNFQSTIYQNTKKNIDINMHHQPHRDDNYLRPNQKSPRNVHFENSSGKGITVMYNTRYDSDDDNGEAVAGALVKEHVSVEDLLEFADLKPCGRQRGVESDEVRIMLKVFNKVTPEQCLLALEFSDWDVHNAIKLISIKLSIGDYGNLKDCYVELLKANGDITKAITSLSLKKRF